MASTSVIASQTAPRSRWSRLQRARKAVEGEIREVRMDALPKGAHYVGNTALSLEHIRNFNAERCVQYLLHDNDCRHYVNDLCAHLCPNAPEAFPRGVASKVSWQSAWQRVRGGRPHEALVVLPLQVFADVNNAPAVQRMKHAASASFAFGLGMRVVPYLAPTLGLRSGVAAALGTFTRAAPTRRLVTTAAGPSRGSPRKRRWSGRRSCSGAPRWAAPSTSPGAWPARAQPPGVRGERRRAGGRRPGCRDGCGGGDLDARGVGRGDGRGRVRGEREGWRVCLQRRRVAAAGAAVGAAAASRRAADDAARAARAFLETSDAADCVGVVGEDTGRDEKGRVRNVAGRVRRPGALPSTVSSASFRPRGRSARLGRSARARRAEDGAAVEGARVVPESPKRKASQGVPRALRFGDPEGRSAKARRFDVRRVFGKVPSAENLAAANGAASSTR